MIVRGITGSKSLVSGRSLGPLYLKSGGKLMKHSATLRIFSMLYSVMYDKTLCPAFDI